MILDVLDKGHVELVEAWGNDLKIANFARASYAKRSDELRPDDERLIRFLATAKPQHTAPFYSCGLDWEVFAPLMTARQWWKHVVASRHVDDPYAAWSEASRRYMTSTPVFYMPGEGGAPKWFLAPPSNKQGSAGPMSEEDALEATNDLFFMAAHGTELYEKWLGRGMCGQQARLFLPAYGMYVSWRWTASLYAVAHFCRLRNEETAQDEIQEYARAVATMAHEKFPVAWEFMLRG